MMHKIARDLDALLDEIMDKLDFVDDAVEELFERVGAIEEEFKGAVADKVGGSE